MPAKRHPLEEIAKKIFANEPSWGPDRVRKQMEDVALASGHDPELLPSVATLGRIKQRMTPLERVDYTYVRWPETFEAGVLPWDAAGDVGELLRMSLGSSSGFDVRPTVQLARWFWRVRQLNPPLEKETCRRIASYMTLIEQGFVDARFRPDVEAYALGLGPRPAIAFNATPTQFRALSPMLVAGGIYVGPEWLKDSEEESD